ncbi:MAG: hypothetical protein ACEQSR_00270 [Candidatus Methylacidiphilales bacterium]
MKEIKIKIDYLLGNNPPQIQFGPFENDKVAMAIVSALTNLDYINYLVETGRIIVIEKNESSKTLIYKFN